MVVMAANAWDKLRPNMQAILGDCPAVNFEGNSYEDSIDILLYHLKPFRNMPAVILEQDFLDRMVEGLKPLSPFKFLQLFLVGFNEHFQNSQNHITCFSS